jgi:hypothetical protein
MDYDELQEKRERVKIRRNSRQNNNYHYARSLGFSAEEAALVRSNGRKRIAEIAKERDNHHAE